MDFARAFPVLKRKESTRLPVCQGENPRPERSKRGTSIWFVLYWGGKTFSFVQSTQAWEVISTMGENPFTRGFGANFRHEWSPGADELRQFTER